MTPDTTVGRRPAARSRERRELGLTTLGLAAITCSTCVFLDGSATASLALRAVGIALLVIATTHRPTCTTTAGRWMPALAVGMALYLIVGTVLHGQWAAGLISTASLVAVTWAAVRWTDGLDGAVVLTAVRRVFTTTVLLSLALGVFLPGESLEQGRLRGLYENANTLGHAALVLGAVSLLRPASRRQRLVALAASSGALVWSASRTSTVALLLVAAAVLVARRSATSTLGLLAVGVVGLAVQHWAPALDGVLDNLLRDTDSRSGTTALAADVLLRRPDVGLGVGNETGVHVSSPLVAVIHAGVPGLLGFVVMAVALLRAAALAGHWSGWVLVLGLLVHSTAESWLLSPTSPLLLTAFCVLQAVLGTSPPPERTSSRPPAPPLLPPAPAPVPVPVPVPAPVDPPEDLP